MGAPFPVGVFSFLRFILRKGFRQTNEPVGSRLTAMDQCNWIPITPQLQVYFETTKEFPEEATGHITVWELTRYLLQSFGQFFFEIYHGIRVWFLVLGRSTFESSSNQSSSTLATDVKFEVQSILARKARAHVFIQNSDFDSPRTEKSQTGFPIFHQGNAEAAVLLLGFTQLDDRCGLRDEEIWDPHCSPDLQCVEKAVDSFGQTKDFNSCPNTFTYNTMLHLLVQKQVYVLALAVYNQMMKSDCRLNRATYGILIDGLCKAGTIEDSIKLFDEMTHRGISPDIMIYTVIVSGLRQEQRTGDAKRLLLDTTK
ncbi:hypothetical protein Syun_006394 [Stephania yunnanensis]|uniref:Pentatricopeptide repeat-containing protein n=1 Tax=Stephania yunnanensis TaxID=152371 RepID=A0AAP0KXZ0_9MAGN